MTDTTILDEGGTGTPTPSPAPSPTPSPSPTLTPAPTGEDDGADWRARLAGDDSKLRGYLDRVPSEKALVELVKKHNDDVKGGKYLKPLPENPTDEETAAWRKAMGVPDKADDYMKSLPEGLVVGEADKPYVDQFLAKMHAAGAPPVQTNAALESYYAIVEEQQAALVEAANSAKNESIETLREEWGGDYKRNLTIMHGYLDTLPAEVAAAFRTGTGADGVPLGYNSAVLKWLTAQAMEANPVATVVPGAGANQASAIADEITSIENVMKTDRPRYNKDEAMQARYRELITARDKLPK